MTNLTAIKLSFLVLPLMAATPGEQYKSKDIGSHAEVKAVKSVLKIKSQQEKKSPYIIHNKTVHVSDVDFKKRKSSAQNLTINLTNANSGATFSVTPTGGNDADWKQIPPPRLTDLTVMEGLYNNMQKNKDNNRSTSTLLSQVTYPFRVKIEISDQNLDVEILEPGDWVINIQLDNKYNPDLYNIPIN